MRRKFPAECLLVGVLWLWCGCSAPHDNPLDPSSPRYRGPDPTPAQLTASVRSVHISRNFPTTDSYSVITELDGPDAARQVSAWVAYDGGSAVALLRTAPATWATIFAASYFQYPNLGTVVGHPFMFTAQDADSGIHLVGPAYMWRVIEDVPQLASPVLSDTVYSATPTYSWDRFDADFPFGYEVNVVNLTAGFETTVWTSPLLPSGSDSILSVQQPESLLDGDYYWTITVEDSFENSSRSKEGGFTIIADSSGVQG